MLVERHASWIALNNVVGCPNNCCYCFLGKNKQINPMSVCSARDAVMQLLQSPLFAKDIPVCIMPNTDIFATKDNKRVFFEVLEELLKNKVTNLITAITKREITTEDAGIISTYIKKGLKICVYVSYSGLPDSFEKGVRHRGVLDALVSMRNLHQYGIPCAHYWRPLIPQNSDPKILKKVMNEVKKYCIGACMTGLKLYPYMSCRDYWPEAQKAYDAGINPECFVPKGAFDTIIKLARANHYKVFVDNVCLMSSLLKQPCLYGLYKSSRCVKYNLCPDAQRNICGEFYNWEKPQKTNKEEIELFGLLKNADAERTHNSEKQKNNSYWQNYFINGEWVEL